MDKFQLKLLESLLRSDNELDKDKLEELAGNQFTATKQYGNRVMYKLIGTRGRQLRLNIMLRNKIMALELNGNPPNINTLLTLLGIKKGVFSAYHYKSSSYAIPDQ